MCNAVEVLLAKYMAGINSSEVEKLGEMEAWSSWVRMLEEQRLEPDRAVVQRNGIGGCEDRDSGGGQDSGRWQT